MRAPDRAVSDRVAELMLSGLSGPKLLAALQRHFGHAKRYDVFMGIALAVTAMNADYAIALSELEVERSLDALERADFLAGRAEVLPGDVEQAISASLAHGASGAFEGVERHVEGLAGPAQGV